ncbi:MAG: methylamine utilization protein [Gammaproteobacteria bacterium]|nr:methylamine utilization protein [Gammaproteobacteria bacterium]
MLLAVSPLSYAQNLSVTIIDSDGAGIADAVVEVVLPAEVAARFATSNDAEIDQVDKEFVPTTTAIVVGSKIHFPNSDDILHHVYSFSPINTFDIPLYGNGVNASFIEEFAEAGVVEIGCNIHDWMLAYVYVANSSKVALSDAEGKVRIDGLPAGTYPLRVWHARLPRNTDYQMESVTIQDSGTAELIVSLELERERRIRRAPSANSKRYR